MVDNNLHRKNREYEIMYLIKPDLTDEALEAIVAKVNDAINNNDGSIVKSQRWSKRYLAYPVNDYKEGYYVILRFMGLNSTLSALDYVLRFSPEIIRSMVLVCQPNKRLLRATAKHSKKEAKK